VGAIVGVLLAVHVLIPMTGLKGAVLAGAMLQIGIALLLLPRSSTAEFPRPVWAALAASVTLILVVGTLLHLDPMRMASGVYRRGQARLPEGAQVSFLRDGKTATISLARQGEAVIIATNGKPDAAINMGAGPPAPDEITMTMAAALPLAMHAAPRDVANIGIGSGLTSQVLLGSTGVRRLDSIEIEPVMAEAARLGFGPRVARLFDDPRSQIHFEDAKTFFAAAGRSYDIIVSEPSNPWISGVATLFSTEFYAQIKRHLKPGGLLVQWIQIYETDLSVVASILKALSPQFADYVVYSTDDADILIVAAPDSRVPGLVNDLFTEPRLAADLRRAGLLTMGDIEIRRIGSKQILDGMFASFDAPANSDFFPFVDLNAPRNRFMNRDALDLVRLSLLPVPVAELLGERLKFPASESVSSARYFTRHQFAQAADGILRAVTSGDPGIAPAEVRPELQILLAPGGDCRGSEQRSAWLHAVHVLASATTSYVPVARRGPFWARVRQTPCASNLEPPEREWFETLAALGTADAAAVAQHGQLLLQSPPAALTANQLVEFLIATVCALDASGQRAAAGELLQAYLPALQSAGRYWLPLRLVQGRLSLRPQEPVMAAAATDRR
jgi:SAM-dependent methyltransferase